MLAVAGVVIWVVTVANTAPELNTGQPLQIGATSACTRPTATRLGFIQADILRTPVASTAIPQTSRTRRSPIEDRRFFQHQGVDFEGIVRAAIKNLENRRRRSRAARR